MLLASYKPPTDVLYNFLARLWTIGLVFQGSRIRIPLGAPSFRIKFT